MAIGAVSLGLNTRAGQIGRSVVNGSPPLRRFFGAVVAQALSGRDGVRHSLRTLA